MLGFGVVPAHRSKTADVSDADLVSLQKALDGGLIASYEVIGSPAAAEPPAEEPEDNKADKRGKKSEKKSKKRG